jgi:hypothetical protein
MPEAGEERAVPGAGEERAVPGAGEERAVPGTGGERAVPVAGEEHHRNAGTPTELTQQIRALYEAGVVPVAELARLAGIHQRTLHKYVAKGGWRRRRAGQEIASAVKKCAAKSNAAPPRSCTTLKGAGGRFIRSADAGKPIRRGLKALDPAGEARALPAMTEAAALAEEALARTRRLRAALAGARELAQLATLARDLAAIEDAAARQAEEAEADRRAAAERLAQERAALARKLEAAVAGWRDDETHGD